MDRAPLNDEILVAISRMVDDAQVETREPSHAQIEDQFRRANLLRADPNQNGRPIGKAKRVREVLSWAIENDLSSGERLVYLLLTLVKGLGGFRESSPNYVGAESIQNLVSCFKSVGYSMSIDGSLAQQVLDDLQGVEAIDALRAYAIRARRGVEDAALLSGTSKDLIEAVAKYVINAKRGIYPVQVNFPTLLGQAFMELGLATTFDKQVEGEQINKRVERSLFEMACAINAFRNHHGTGHGRPVTTSISVPEGKLVIEIIGVVSEFLLSKI